MIIAGVGAAKLNIYCDDWCKLCEETQEMHAYIFTHIYIRNIQVAEILQPVYLIANFTGEYV